MKFNDLDSHLNSASHILNWAIFSFKMITIVTLIHKSRHLVNFTSQINFANLEHAFLSKCF